MHNIFPGKWKKKKKKKETKEKERREKLHYWPRIKQNFYQDPLFS